MAQEDDLTALAEAVGVLDTHKPWKQATIDGVLYTAAAGVLYIGAASYAQILAVIV